MQLIYHNIDWLSATTRIPMDALIDRILRIVAAKVGRTFYANHQCMMHDLAPRTCVNMTPLSTLPVEVQTKDLGRICVVGDSWLLELHSKGCRIEFWGRHFAANQLAPAEWLECFASMFLGAPELDDWALTRLDLASDFIGFDRFDHWSKVDAWTGLGMRCVKMTVVSSKASGPESIYLSKGGDVSCVIYNKTLQLRHQPAEKIRAHYMRLWEGSLGRPLTEDESVTRVEVRMRSEPLKEIGERSIRQLVTGNVWAYVTGAWCRPMIARHGRSDRTATDVRWAKVRASCPGGDGTPPERHPVPGRGSTPQQAAGVLRSALVWDGWSKAEANKLSDAELMEAAATVVRSGRATGRGHSGSGND